MSNCTVLITDIVLFIFCPSLCSVFFCSSGPGPAQTVISKQRPSRLSPSTGSWPLLNTQCNGAHTLPAASGDVCSVDTLYYICSALFKRACSCGPRPQPTRNTNNLWTDPKKQALLRFNKTPRVTSLGKVRSFVRSSPLKTVFIHFPISVDYHQ